MTILDTLKTITLSLTAAQLRAAPVKPISLLGSPPAGFAYLLRTLIASLTFETQAFVAGLGSQAALFYSGPARFGVIGGDSTDPALFLSQQITGVAAAVGGVTVYTLTGPTSRWPTLGALPVNALVGLQAQPVGCTHSQNNVPGTITANTATTITVTNASGVAESSPPGGAAMQVYAPLALVGGGGETIDLTETLTESTESQVQGWTIDQWLGLPRTEIEGAGIYLGTAQTGLLTPAAFTAGDGSLVLTLEYLVAQL